MSYHSRYEILENGSLFHLTWRFHDKTWFFKSEWAKEFYYELLLKYKDRYNVQIYSYSFMSNHFHLTGSIDTLEEFSSFFRVVHTVFAKKLNKRLRRCGQVIMDRPKSPRIEDDSKHLNVIIYGDLNQVRQRMVKHPKNYKWSSYKYYAYGKADPLITPAPSYIELGKTFKERQNRYRAQVEYALRFGTKKMNYSSVMFIGKAEWVAKKNQHLKMVMKAKREAYLKRQRRQLAHHY